MHIDSTSLLLYAVTDRTWLYGKKLADQVEESIRGGVTFVQLREKNLSLNQFVEQAQEEMCIRDSICSITPATRTIKNSSKLEAVMERKFRRSIMGLSFSNASSNTRMLKSSQLNSRLW